MLQVGCSLRLNFNAYREAHTSCEREVVIRCAGAASRHHPRRCREATCLK